MQQKRGRSLFLVIGKLMLFDYNVNNVLANDSIVVTSLALGAESNDAFFHSVERKILACTDILAWEVVCTTLAENNLSWGDFLAMV